MPRRKKQSAVAGLVLLLIAAAAGYGVYTSQGKPREGDFTIVTWNVRGYPEKDAAGQKFFHDELVRLNPDVVCIQEIANKKDADEFVSREGAYSKTAFADSGDGQDNAIFAKDDVGLTDMPDPQGFQHPAQEAYVYRGGFDAVVITVHLSWTDEAMREKEKLLLKDVVKEALAKDPDVIVCGDFNTTEAGIQELANSTGMVVMVPKGQDGVGTTHAGNRYDHFLVSPDLAKEEAVSCRIETFTGEDDRIAESVSDHVPVVAYFSTDAKYQDRK
jgi:endonuclease/exonuclease/phosphatase family metal-dependent hydrolase